MSSEQHKALAVRCQPWLRRRITGRGMRGGFEVPLADGYVADWVALCGFQNRYERQYVEERHFEKHHGVRVSPEFACIFEVKINRTDFCSTFGSGLFMVGERQYPVGSLHWIVVPCGLIEAGEVPAFWGLLETAGTGLRSVRVPRYFPMMRSNLYSIAYHMLWYGKDYAG